MSVVCSLWSVVSSFLGCHATLHSGRVSEAKIETVTSVFGKSFFFCDFSATKSEKVIITTVLTCSPICSRVWNESIVQDACQLLSEDMPLAHEAPGGQVEYRRSLASSFFFRFYLNISQQLGNGEVHVNFMNGKHFSRPWSRMIVFNINDTSR